MAGPTLRLNLDASGMKQGAREADAALNKVKTGAKETEVAVNKSGSAISRMGKMSGQQRFVFQNTANQLGDIAVQASMGTNIFRVLGQQIPQIAGGFAILGGAIGPIAAILSVVAAVGFPLIAMFTQLGSGAKSLAENMDDLEDETDSAVEKLGQALVPMSELETAFNEFAQQVRNTRIEIAALTLDKLERDVMRTGDAVASFAENAGIFERLRYGSEQFGSAVRKLQNVFEISKTEAEGLRDALAAVDNATNPEELAEAFGALVTALANVNPETDEAKDALFELATAASRGEESTARLIEMQDRFKDKTTEVTDSVNTLKVAVTDLADNMDIMSAFGGMGDFRYDLPTRFNGKAVFDENKRREEAAKKQAETRLKAEQRELQNAVKQYKPAITAAQEYKKAIEDIQKAVAIKAITEQEGAIATAEATRRYQVASGELADYTSIANDFASSLEDSLMSLADGTSSVKDAFKSMATMVIRELYRVLVVQQLVNSVMGAFGFSPSMGGGYVPTAGVGAYGGPVEAGKGVVVGERGPEVFYPSMSGTIVPNGASGGDVVVNQTINVSTGVQQTVRTEIRALMPEIAQNAKSAVIDAKRRGGGYGKAFG